MAHSKGLYDEKITILNRKDVVTEHGAKKGTDYVPDGSPVWANVSWLKGKKAMMEASLDALNSYLVRTAYHERLDDHSRIMWNGKTFQIDPPKKDKRANECSFTMYEQA